MTLHINWTRIDKIKKQRRQCIGGHRSTFVCWDGGGWYGWYGTCLRCGEEFGGGEWMARPFMRGWRQANIAKAKKLWSERETRLEASEVADAS